MHTARLLLSEQKSGTLLTIEEN